jgi:hypothetical protein
VAGDEIEYEECKLAVAGALRELERRLADLVAALAHADTEVSVQGVRDPRRALGKVGEAYAAIDFVGEREDEAPKDVLGVLGVPAHVLARAVAVNEAKDRLKEVCKPLEARRRAAPIKDRQGASVVKPMQWVRLILREIGRPRLNLLAAYRHIPILEKRPARVGYVQARTRAVYKRSREELLSIVSGSMRVGAEEDIARLRKLPPNERFLALVREHYDNVRANVTYPSLDSRSRGRVQIRARLPILYPLGRSKEPPLITYPGDGDQARRERAARPSKLREEPYLTTLTVHRYANPTHARSKP